MVAHFLAGAARVLPSCRSALHHVSGRGYGALSHVSGRVALLGAVDFPSGNVGGKRFRFEDEFRLVG